VDLEAYRQSAETFERELTDAYYRHYAGITEDYPIEAIYDRHAALFNRPGVQLVRDALDHAEPGSEEHRRRVMLLDFATEGHIGEATKQLEAELARREASIVLDVGGGPLGFRESDAAQANEPDQGRRAEIEAARLDAIAEQLNPLHEQVIETQHGIARELGYGSYRELCAECKGIELTSLNAETLEFSARTRSPYPAVVEPELQQIVGLGLAQAGSADLRRFFRAPTLDVQYPAGPLIPSFSDTMRGLGIDVTTQARVVLDVDPRPNKTPRAFCAPVRVPDEVYLVLAPIGGRDDYSVLFHEGGHTEHYAHVGRDLPFEFRYLGDNTITEAFAFLLQHLVDDPEWLQRRLGIEDATPIAAYVRASRLVYMRRYAAKLAYELELHGQDGSLTGRADRYAQLLGDALLVRWPSQTYLADVDSGFYCACYLRAWALETQIRRYLRERFGPAWFDSAEAGAVLRELWREGQRRSPEELLSELTGERLRFGVLVDDLAL
jgi:hypothetical protein